MVNHDAIHTNAKGACDMKTYKDQFAPQDLSCPPAFFKVDGVVKAQESINAWRVVNDAFLKAEFESY